jgi:hypothetical protein
VPAGSVEQLTHDDASYADPAVCPDGSTRVDAKFLYYPDENHWILGPGNAAVWYETVLAFLAQHVLGEPWRRPAAV